MGGGGVEEAAADASALAQVVFPTLEFEVVKWHDKMRWLRQDRIIRLSDAGIENVRKKTGVVTRQFPYDAIKYVRLVARDYIILAFLNDHDYHYLTEEAVRIAWEVNERMKAHESTKRFFKFISTRGQKPTFSEAFRRNKMPTPWDLEDRLVLRQQNSLLELQITEMLLAPNSRAQRWVSKLQAAAEGVLERCASPVPSASPLTTPRLRSRSSPPAGSDDDVGCRAVQAIGDAIADVRRLVMEHYVLPASTHLTAEGAPAPSADTSTGVHANANDLGITFVFQPMVQRNHSPVTEGASAFACAGEALPRSPSARTDGSSPCVARSSSGGVSPTSFRRAVSPLVGYGGEIHPCGAAATTQASDVSSFAQQSHLDVSGNLAVPSPTGNNGNSGFAVQSRSPTPVGNASFGGRTWTRKMSKVTTRDRGASSIGDKKIYVVGGEEELQKCIERCLQKVLFQPDTADAAYHEILRDDALSAKRSVFRDNHRFLYNKPVTYFGIPASLHSCGWMDAVHELEAMSTKRLPHEKMECIMLMVRQVFLVASVDSTENVESYSLDNLLPLIIFVIARCSLLEPLVEAEYIMSLTDSSTADEQAYYLTVFVSALEYIATLDRTQRTLFAADGEEDPAAATTRRRSGRRRGEWATPPDERTAEAATAGVAPTDAVQDSPRSAQGPTGSPPPAESDTDTATPPPPAVGELLVESRRASSGPPVGGLANLVRRASLKSSAGAGAGAGASLAHDANNLLAPLGGARDAGNAGTGPTPAAPAEDDKSTRSAPPQPAAATGMMEFGVILTPGHLLGELSLLSETAAGLGSSSPSSPGSPLFVGDCPDVPPSAHGRRRAHFSNDTPPLPDDDLGDIPLAT